VNAATSGGEALTITGAASFARAVGTTALSQLSVSGTTALNGGSVTTTGTQTYSGAVTLGADATLTATTVSFGGTVDAATSGGEALTITGAASFAKAVGTTALKQLSVSGAADLNGGSVTTTGTQTYSSAVTLSADTTLTGTTITFGGTVDAATPGGEALTVSGAASFAHAVGTTALSSLSVSGAAALNGGSVTTTGTQTYSGAVTLGADATLTGTTITFSGTVDAATSGGESLTISGAASLAKAVGTTALKQLSVSGAADLNGGPVTTTGAQSYGGPVTLTADAILTSTASGDITFTSTVNGTFALTVNTAGTTTFGGAVGGGGQALTSLTTDAPGGTHLNGATITTSGAQHFQDAVTLGANVTLDSSAGGGDLVFGGTVDADAAANNRTLTLTAGAGSVHFTQAVGAGQSLASLTVNSAANVTFDGTVRTSGDLTQMAGTGTTTFNGGTIGGGLGVVAGAVVLNSGTLAVTGTAALGPSAGGVTENSGAALTAASLVLTGTGTFTLAQAGNNVGTLAASVNGALTYTDVDQLTVGSVRGTDGVNTGGHDLTLRTVGLLTLGDGGTTEQDVTASGATVTLASAGVAQASNSKLTAASLLLQGNGSFTLGNAANAVGTLAANVSGSGHSLQFTNAGALTVGQVGSTAGLSTTSGSITVQASGTVTLSRQVNAGSSGSVTITATAGNIQVNADVLSTAGSSGSAGDGTGTLTLHADAGSLSGTGTLKASGAGGRATLTAATGITVNTSVQDLSAQNSTSGNITVNEADDITLLGVSTLGSNGSISVASAAGQITVSGAVSANGSGAVQFTAASGVMLTATGSVSTSGPYTVSADSDANGAGVYSQAAGSTVSSGVVNITASDVNLSGTITSGSADVTLAPSTAGATIGIEDASKQFTLTNAELSRITTTGVLHIGSAANTGGITIGTDASIAQAKNLAFLTGSTITVNGAVSTTGGGTVTLTNGGTLSITAAGAMSLDGAFTQNGTGAVSTAGNITTTNDTIHFTSAVTLTGDVTLSTGSGAGDITFDSTVNGPSTLTLDAGTGAVNLAGAVGGLQPLQGLTVSSAAAASLPAVKSRAGGIQVTATAITLNGDLNTTAAATAGPVALTGGVTLGATTVQITTHSTTDGSVTVTGATDASASGAQSLTVQAGGGDVAFTGAVGGSRRLNNLTVSSAHDLSAGGIRAAAFTQSAGSGTTTLSGAIDTSGAGGVSLTGTHFAITGSVTVAGGGGLSVTDVTSLSISTGAVNLNAGTFTVDGAGTASVSSDVSGTGGSFVKSGAGTLTLSGTDGFTGTATLNAGTLLVNGTITSGTAALTVSGGTLGGTGTIQRPVHVNGGTLDPGVTTGTLGTGAATFASAATFRVQIRGTSAGTDYDQLIVSGDVNLNGDNGLGVTLAADFGSFVPAPGTIFTLIRNDGSNPVQGTFKGLPEGALVTTINGVAVRVSYQGGDGNDVILAYAGPLVYNSAGGDLTLRKNGPELQLLAGTAVVDSRPLVSVNSVTINGEDHVDNHLTVDYAFGGYFTTDVTFHGGSGGGDNGLLLKGGTFTAAAHTFTDAGDGSFALDGGAIVAYTEVNQPVTMTGTAASLTLNLPGSDNDAVLGDDGLIGNGLSEFRTTGPTTADFVFANPTGSLTINGGAEEDTITVAPDFDSGTGAGQFHAALAIDGQGGTDTITVDPALSAAGVTLTAEAIHLDGGSVTTTGTQTYTGPVTLGADTTLTGTAVSFAGTVDAASAGAEGLTIAGAVSFASAVGTTALKQLSVSGAADLNGGSVTTTGAQSYGGAVTLTADTTLTASSVSFSGTVDAATAGGESLTVTGAASFGGAVGTTALSHVSVSGSAALNGGSVTTTGTQSYGGPVTLGANTSLTVSSVSFGGTVDAATVGGESLTVTGAASFAKAVRTTALSALSVSGAADLNGGAVTTTGTQSYGGAVTLTADTTLTASSVSFGGTVDAATSGGESLTVTGAASFAKAVGATALSHLSVSGAAALNGGAITTAGTQTYGGAVTLGADATLTATAVSFAGTVDDASAGAESLTVTGSASFGGAVGATALSQLSVSGAAALNGGSVKTTGVQSYAGPVTLGSDNTLTVSTASFAGTVNATTAGAQGLTVTGAASFAMPVGGTALKQLSVSGAAALNGGTVATTGGQSYGGAVTLGADTTLTSTGGGDIAFSNTLNSDATAARTLTVNTAGTTTFGVVGNIHPLAALLTDSPGAVRFLGSTVITTGAQTYNDAASLGVSTTLQATLVTFGGTLDGAGSGGQSLTVSGAASFTHAVGTTALAALSVSGAAALNGGSVTTTGTQTYGGAVTLGANATLTATTISFIGTVDAATPGGEGLALAAGSGDITFAGVVGTAGRLSALTVSSVHNLSAGTVLAGTITQAAGSGTTSITGTLDAGSINLTGTNLTLTGPVNLSGAGPLALTASGTVNVGGPGVSLSGASFTVSNAGPGVLSAPISGAGGLTKSGAGTLTLTATDSYAGATLISQGTLLVDGVLSAGGGAVTVAAGGTLGGTGTIQRPVNVSGTLAPGDGGSGRLATGSVAFSPGSVFAVDLDGPVAGSSYDQLAVTGTVSLGGATLVLAGGFTPAPGAVLVLVSNDGSDAVAPGFAGLPEGSPVNVGGFAGFLSYAGGDGNDVTVTASGPVSASGAGDYTLRRSGGNVQLLRGGTLLDSRPLAAVTDYAITGADNVPDSLTVDFAFGGFFAVGGAVAFNGGAGGPDHLAFTGGTFAGITDAMTGPDSGSVTYTPAAGAALLVNYGGVESVDLSGTTTPNLTFQLPASSDQAVLTERGAAGASTFASANATFTATTFLDPATSLAINLGAGDDSLTVRRTAAGPASLSVDGGAGTNSLALDFSALTGGDTVFITKDTVTSVGLPGPIHYTATGGTFGGGLTVTTGAGNDIVYVQSTALNTPTLVQTGAGDDSVIVSSDPGLRNGVLNGLAGRLTIDAGPGKNSLVLSDAAQGVGNQVWVTDHAIAGVQVPFSVSFKATGGNFNRGIALITGAGNDTINVLSQFPGAPTWVYTNGGDDTFHVSVTSASAYANLVLDGGSGTDTLLVYDQSGAAVMHNRVFLPGQGQEEVTYLGGAGSVVAYQNMDFAFDSVDPQGSYVQELYNTYLGMKASPADLGFWTGVLNSAGRDAVVQGILASAPARLHTAEGWFQTYLGFTPPLPTAQFWADQLLGQDQEKVLAEFVSSDVYYARAGGTDAAFAQRLYRDLLQHDPSPEQMQAALDSLLPQVGRQGLAWLLLTSAEYRTLAMDARYQMLHRSASPAELDYWTFNGMTQDQIDRAFAELDEFYNLGT
jgi:hypothetical protein